MHVLCREWRCTPADALAAMGFGRHVPDLLIRHAAEYRAHEQVHRRVEALQRSDVKGQKAANAPAWAALQRTPAYHRYVEDVVTRRSNGSGS